MLRLLATWKCPMSDREALTLHGDSSLTTVGFSLPGHDHTMLEISRAKTHVWLRQRRQPGQPVQPVRLTQPQTIAANKRQSRTQTQTQTLTLTQTQTQTQTPDGLQMAPDETRRPNLPQISWWGSPARPRPRPRHGPRTIDFH